MSSEVDGVMQIGVFARLQDAFSAPILESIDSGSPYETTVTGTRVA